MQALNRSSALFASRDPEPYRNAPAIKITYFPTEGRAEPIRLTLYVGGIEFEDERFTGEEIAVLKEEGKVPFLSMPTMTVDDEIFAESGAMLRYAGKLTGMYPTCAKAALKVDMVNDALESIISDIFKDPSKEGRTKVIEETFPRYFGAIDKIYSASAGPYLLGETMSVADIKVMCFVEGVNKGGNLDHIPAGCLDKYSHLLSVTKTVLENQKVKEWKAAH